MSICSSPPSLIIQASFRSDPIPQYSCVARCRLDVYIYDYLVKRNLQATAKAFIAEGKVATDPVAIDAPGGFLFEWWSIFWDIFHSSTAKASSSAGAPPPHLDVCYPFTSTAPLLACLLL